MWRVGIFQRRYIIIISTTGLLNYELCFISGARPLNRGFKQGFGSQNIFLFNTICDGSEQSILDCPTKPLGGLQRSLCRHTNDVGVKCQPANLGDLRIRGGPRASAGRIEVYANHAWGTVCTDFWYQKDAEVACRQLGFSDSGESYIYSY